MPHILLHKVLKKFNKHFHKIRFLRGSPNKNLYLPTKANITVSSGEAGKLTVTLNSNICSKSTETNRNIFNIKFPYRKVTGVVTVLNQGGITFSFTETNCFFVRIAKINWIEHSRRHMFRAHWPSAARRSQIRESLTHGKNVQRLQQATG